MTNPFIAFGLPGLAAIVIYLLSPATPWVAWRRELALFLLVLPSLWLLVLVATPTPGPEGPEWFFTILFFTVLSGALLFHQLRLRSRLAPEDSVTAAACLLRLVVIVAAISVLWRIRAYD